MRKIARMLGLAAVLIAVAVTASGCWLQEGWESGRSFSNALESTLSVSTATSLHRLWTSPNENEGAPVVGGGSVYEVGFVAGTGGYVPMLYSFDESTGAPNWSVALATPSLNWITYPDSPALGSVVYGGNGFVFADVSQYPGFFSNSQSLVVAVNISTASVSWRTPFNGVEFEGPLIFGTAPSRASGTEVPVLFASTSGGYVAAIDASSGVVLQTIGVGTFDTSVAVGNGPIYVGGRTGDLYSLSPTTGTVNWAVPVAPKCTSAVPWFPAVDGNRVIVADACGQVAAFSATTGKLLWRTAVLAADVPSWVAVAGGQVVVALGATVFSRSDATGTSQWTTTLANPATGGPTIANGVVYLDDGGGLVTLNQSSGLVLSTVPAPAGATFDGEAAVSDGRLFVYGGGTGLLAYGP